MIDLRPDHLDTVKRILSEHVPGCEVRAFGSRVEWTAKDYSDLDLAIAGQGRLGADTLRRLKEAFAESDLPFRVDILDWHDISKSFQKVIEKQYAVIQKGGGRPSPDDRGRGVPGAFDSLDCLPGEWSTRRVGDFASVKGGKRLPLGTAVVRTRTSHPYLRIVDFKAGRIDKSNLMFVPDDVFPSIARYTIRSRDIYISIVGSIGLVGIVDSELDGANLTENAAKICDIANEVDRDYLAYFLRSGWGQQQIEALTVGSTQPKLALFRIEDISVPLPPLPEQRGIAHILGTLDDKIELNRRMSETLEAMARALFKSWFVDFEPVRAKAEGRDPGLPAPLAALFPDRLVDSELGEIPEGWEVGCVDDEFNLTMGQSPPGQTYNETGEGIPFYQGRADFTWRFPTRRIYCTAPTRFARAGDTLISVRAPVGDINMASEDCAIGRGVAAARHKSGSRSYTYQIMRGLEEVFTRFEAEGTVFGSISKKDFHAIPCVAVPTALVQSFERTCAPIDSRIETCERETHTLAALRDALLPKLISGELRVKDAERFIGRAI